jgi:hypothetical protein
VETRKSERYVDMPGVPKIYSGTTKVTYGERRYGMAMSRNVQTLMSGLKAAYERMSSGNGLRKPEYPPDLQKMYSGMEDELFRLYVAIQNKKYTLVRRNAADIIVTASEVIEYAKLLVRVKDEPWDTED